MFDKPWLDMPINDNGETLQVLPPEIARVKPHPYQQLGAPYHQASPHCVRSGVLKRLVSVQGQLQQTHPGSRLRVFDAYRPNAVQRFMVTHTYTDLRAKQPQLSERELWDMVYTFWAQPSEDPATPPAHSTGAAIDLTLQDDQGRELDMGTPIDEFSPRAHPEYFADNPEHAQIQRNRQLLRTLMLGHGFAQHPAEWWHFSYGDQLWAWRQLGASGQHHNAVYGRADLVSTPQQPA